MWIVIAGNVLWVLGSAGVLASGELEPNGMGNAFVVMQAAAVAVLTALEIRGVRRLVGAEGAGAEERLRTGTAPSR